MKYSWMRCMGAMVVAVCLAATYGCTKSEDERVSGKLGINATALHRVKMRTSLSNQALLEMNPEEVSNTFRDLRPDLPQARAAFRNLQQRANGEIPPDARKSALAALVGLENRPQSVVGGLQVGRAARVGGFGLVPNLMRPLAAPGKWDAMGPGKFGGRTRSIVIDPKNAERIWIGSVGGGIWYSDNGGETFSPVDDFMPNLAICCMTMDQHDPNKIEIYAGTGEGFYNGDAIRGGGVYRSPQSPQGKWSLLTGSDKPQMLYMNRIAISADGRTLLAAGHNGKPLYKDGEQNSDFSGGIFRSTLEGTSWTTSWPQSKRTDGKVLNADVADVKFHPTDNSLAIAGGFGTAWHSSDAGQQWVEASHDGDWNGRVELAYARKDPSIVYALVDSNSGEIYKSTNGGQSYTKVTTKLSIPGASILGNQGWYDNVIWVGDPTNSDFIIAGGVNLWKSTDGGATFSDITNWTKAGSVHADQHSVVASPDFATQNNKTLFVGNDGGIWKTNDISTVGSDAARKVGWESLNKTYATTQFFGGAINLNSGSVMAGAQDNGTLELDKDADVNDWRVTSEGDGGWCFAHPKLPNVFFGEYVLLDLIRSVDGGRHSQDLSGVIRWLPDGTAVWRSGTHFIPDAKVAINDNPDDSRKTANFIAPFAVDMQHPNRIFAGGAQLWRTEDADATITTDAQSGPSWVSVKEALPESSPDRLISSVGISPTDSNTVWVGYNSGRIFRTQNASDANPAWSEINVADKQKSPKGKMNTRIVFSRTNPKKVFVTFGGYETDNVWITENDGVSWASLHSNLPKMPIYALTEHPQYPNVLYVASELGLFTSMNTGKTWSVVNSGPANCSVQDLFWMGNTLFATTHARGMFKVDLSRVLH